jgi:hypothetical protein
MTDTNRMRIALVREVTAGTTPGSPVMRVGEIVSESLVIAPQVTQSAAIRSDRMSADPTLQNQRTQGGISFAFTFPEDLGFYSELFQSAMYALWTRTAQHANDQTADSAITDAGTTANTYVVTDQSGSGGFAGSAYVVGHLVRATGFTNAANNQIFRVASSTSTTVVGTSLSLTAETVPPATARLKVVGFQGASGDITASTTGLASTSLNFTTLGLQVGQWVKIGDASNANFQFATAALNDWARITAIAASALTLDHRPSGWGTDTGTSKTIRVFFGDVIKNGTTDVPLTVEKGFLAQGTPTYPIHRGGQASGLSLDLQAEQTVTGSVDLMFLSGVGTGTSAVGVSYVAFGGNAEMAASADVGRIMEAGAAVTATNSIRRLQIALNNYTRMLPAIGTVGAIGLGEGEAAVTGTIEAYFGSTALLAKALAQPPTATSVATRLQKNNQAVPITLPRLFLTGGSPSAGGKNQDVIYNGTFLTARDPATNCHIQFDRLEYFN